ncbi:MAG: hypothetical protein IPK73_20960 [Candidatus Obscuribacter sp.]|nr:hypothetical protein [Candidatus Obscuribacter sp.]MBK9276588.1 hypothetical protein [Candidatus Obscuribacter sp.]
MQASFSELAASPFFRRLAPLSLYLLHMGVIGLSEFQHTLAADIEFDLHAQIDGKFLWSHGLLSTTIWRQAVTELRLLETGRVSLDELECAGPGSLSDIDQEELFGLDTWLLSNESLSLPSVLSFLEEAISSNRLSTSFSGRLSLSVPLPVQKVIVSLKIAVRSGKIALEQAVAQAQLTYDLLHGASALNWERRSLANLDADFQPSVSQGHSCVAILPAGKTSVDTIEFPFRNLSSVAEPVGTESVVASQVA